MAAKRLSPPQKVISAKERARRSRLKAVGALGGRATLRKHGRGHMAEIGKKGWMVFVARHFAGNQGEAMAAIQDRAWGVDLLKKIKQRENLREDPDGLGGSGDDIGRAYRDDGLPTPADLDPYCDGGADEYEPALCF